MKLRTFTLLLFLIGPFLSLEAQQRGCSTMDYFEFQRSSDPGRPGQLDQIERFTGQVLAEGLAVGGVITIPVVVHVVYNTSAENISMAQIQSQIQVLNEDFRRLNADADNTWPQAADIEIEFCLASVDPNGNPTNGVTRTATSTTSFGTNNQVKFTAAGGKDAWPAASYMNVWVCDIGGSILGYAQFPGGPASSDGIVVDYRYFGTTGVSSAPFDLGRTCTHEVGHWLNLRHIWGDGACNADDFVSDTPLAGAPNYTNSPCSFPGPNTCHTGVNDEPDMFQNYMDYSYDACMNLFTHGQRERMRALFEPGGPRSSLLASSGCTGNPVEPTCSDGIQNGDETGVDCGGSCSPCVSGCVETEVNLTLVLDNYPQESSWRLLDASGIILESGGTYGNLSDGSTVNADFCLPEGCYDFVMRDSYGDGLCCSYGRGSYMLTDGDGNVLASGARFGTSETTNFCLGGGSEPTCSDGIQNGDETGIDCGGSCPDPCNTCSDGIQNGDETGIDCGGSCPDACPTCFDGIQNGDETGIDCGGSCPNTCPTCFDGIQNGDETGIDCGGSCPNACNTCSDGIQNGDETGIDCGGSCPDACNTCSDGIQNGDETGIDCGGSCPDACNTCSDGIQNGDETGIDCGGSCPDACPTCFDGVQNGDETGIDCGGPCLPCEGDGSCNFTIIDENNFESGWGIWNDGGSDCRRSANDRNYAIGFYCIRLRDNSSSSVTTTDDLNLASYDQLKVDFSYLPLSMDNLHEDFFLEISTNGGNSYSIVEEWNRGDEFENNQRYYESVEINGPFTSSTRLRFRCDASGNSDWVYIDEVVISGCSENTNIASPFTPNTAPQIISFQSPVEGANHQTMNDLKLYPNPVSDQLTVTFDVLDAGPITLSVMDLSGKLIEVRQIQGVVGRQQTMVNTSNLHTGFYFLQLKTAQQRLSRKFVVTH